MRFDYVQNGRIDPNDLLALFGLVLSGSEDGPTLFDFSLYWKQEVKR